MSRLLSLERNFKIAKKRFRVKEDLPLQIGWKEKLSTFDAFFECHETLPYKFDIDSKRNVFIVEMGGTAHSMLATTLGYMFNAPNGGILLDPPNTSHYRPDGGGVKNASDVEVHPGAYVIPKTPLTTPLRLCLQLM
ncbi:8716_t:CDS:2 [Paraglomus brasilianum]|uniref:8716_t:CDS:1 n=1 Tax=Paraglomus brasilianum TaxID=144538 RepID=A0A9N9H0G6_9GLOM|nr:8716_t:CDS:2 [Paraglomus brasilianum]